MALFSKSQPCAFIGLLCAIVLVMSVVIVEQSVQDRSTARHKTDSGNANQPQHNIESVARQLVVVSQQLTNIQEQQLLHPLNMEQQAISPQQQAGVRTADANPKPVDSVRVQEIEPCCKDMITGKCTREFGPAERAVQDSIMAAWSFTSLDMALNKILEEDNRNLARVAACGEPIAISQVNHKRGCGVGNDPAFCALSKFPGGNGHISHPDAVSRQAAYVGCLRTIRATPAPADIIHCLNMPRAVTCAHTFKFGSEEDPCTVCITEEFFKDSCTLYAIGVGFSWEVENQLADWFPKCTILMFDPTPESGPHEILNMANMPENPTYRAQVVISGRQRHANIWMHALGISDKDQIMVFKNHFLKGPGVPTGLLSPGSLTKLHGPTREHPLMLKLDVEGLEFTFMDQLLDLKIPQLNLDFHMDESTKQHPFKLDALTGALIKLAEAGYYAVGPNICNGWTKAVKDGSCIGASPKTSSHDFRTQQGKTYIHLNFVRGE